MVRPQLQDYGSDRSSYADGLVWTIGPNCPAVEFELQKM